MPKEFLLAFVEIARACRFDVLDDFETIGWFKESNLILLLYKYGVTPDRIPPNQPGDDIYFYQRSYNPFEIAHNSYYYNEKAEPNSDGRSRAEQNSDNCPIETLLPELIWSISHYLNIIEVVALFTTSKKMTRFLKKEDDSIWRRLCEGTIGVNKKIHHYKRFALQYARSAPNWIKRNFNKIVLKGFKPFGMDENWLILSNQKTKWFLWDCHTQKLHLICRRAANFTPVRILGSVYDGRCPPVLVRILEGQLHRDDTDYGLIVNGKFIALDNLRYPFDDIDNRPHQIDENLLLLPNNQIYDIQSRSIIDSTLNNHSKLIYNPFNRTYITINKNSIAVWDLNHQLLKQYQTEKRFDYHSYVMMNEFTLIGYGSRGCRWLIELNEREIAVKSIDAQHSGLSQYSRLILPHSLDRAILADDGTGLVTICHLPSMQWQAVYHLQATVTAANSRYLVGNENGNAVIYDFCK